jgi:hypothetical protein
MKRFLVVAFLSSTVAFDLQDYEDNYMSAKDVYERAMARLNDAVGPYEAARDAYVSATSTYTHSLYPDLEVNDRNLPQLDHNLNNIDDPDLGPRLDEMLQNYKHDDFELPNRRLLAAKSYDSQLSSIFKLEHNYWSSDRTNRELIAKKYINEAMKLVRQTKN